jgi:hypothetical protein
MTLQTKRVVHCWEDGPRTEDDCGTTCMLLNGHSGPHKWTRDDQIGIKFADGENARDEDEAAQMMDNGRNLGGHK